MKKATRGRPRKSPGEHYATPHFSIGRVPVAVQDEIRDAAKRSGKSLTEWATDVLTRAARRKRAS